MFYNYKSVKSKEFTWNIYILIHEFGFSICVKCSFFMASIMYLSTSIDNKKNIRYASTYNYYKITVFLWTDNGGSINP